jgi:hypothetical protein
MSLRIGVLALARPTFDVPYAQEMAARAFASLDAAGIATLGSRELLFDAAATEAALAGLAGERLDLLLVLQVTFTDATMTVRIAEAATAPLAIWAFPEPRAGGRLRLNASQSKKLQKDATKFAQKKYGSSGATNGLSSSLAFTPVQGIELVNPNTKPLTLGTGAGTDSCFSSLRGFSKVARELRQA